VSGQANIVPAERSLPREDPNFSPVGDLFAPFFDVVFYSSTTEAGEVEPEVDPFDFEGSIAAAIQQAQQTAALGNTAAIGSSTIALRSVGGGLQSYSPEGPESEIGQLINYRSNLEITMLSAASLQATLTLTPPYEAALAIIDNQLIKFGSLMEVQWGYLALDGSGTPAVSDKGLFRITQPSIKFGAQVSVTIGGFDILSSSLQTTETRCQWLREKYPTDLDIVNEIIKKRAGAGTKLDDARVKLESPLRKRKAGEGITQTDDDWTFFRRILRQNDVSFIQLGSTIVLEDEERISIAEPKYRLFWYGQVQNEYDVPMTSFETNPIASLFATAPGVRGQRTISRDADTGAITATTKDPGKTGVPQTGAANTQTTNEGFKTAGTQTSEGTIAPFAPLGDASSGRFVTQPARRPNQEEENERENRELRRFFNTRASAVCPGVPGILPQQVVEVRNVGETFSGNYRVMKVVHNIGAGYTMKLDLLRSASSGTAGQGDPASSDKANIAATDPDAPPGQFVTETVQEDS
jgi:hypothetical protein